jgi:outer membrane protein OmpA-like peptidoglycan-associated protein
MNASLGIVRRMMLCLVAVSCGAFAHTADTTLEDYTHKLSLHPGLVFTGTVSNSHHADGSVISGDYQVVINFQEVTDTSTSITWSMTYPADEVGHGVAPYIAGSYKVNIYSWRNNAPPDGFNPYWRPSREFYESLKSGKATPLEFDGYQSPGSIQMVATEYLVTLVNEKKVRISAIKGKTPQLGYFWILDNPEFPAMVKTESPIFDFFISDFRDANFAANDLVDQLRQKGTATSHAVLFALNAADLSRESKGILDAVASFMKGDPSVKLTIEGHTDNIGGEKFNLDLSRRRAESVKNYLRQQGGIAGDRLTAKGLGMSRPVATNKTADGRAFNRRVVFQEARPTAKTR